MPTHDLTTVQINPEELTLHPENPNHGDVEAIANSIRVNGFYEPVIVQASTGYVISGNHRVKAARQLGLETVPVIYLDVDDTAARRILLASNATAQKAVVSDLAVARVLNLIADEDSAVTGVGYDTDEVEDYLAILAHTDNEEARYAAHQDETPAPDPAPEPATPRATPGATPRDPEPTPAPEAAAGRSTPAPRRGPGLDPVHGEDPVAEDTCAYVPQRRTNPARRTLILDLPIEAHAWLTARLDEIREENGSPHRTQALLDAVGEATGRKPPRLTGPEYTDPDTDGVPQK